MTVIRRALTLTLTAASILAVSSAWANSIFLKIPNVVGPATAQGYQGDIPLLSYSQGFSNPATITTGGGNAGKVNCGAIDFGKSIDQTSPTFLQYVTTGVTIPSATVYFLSSPASGPSNGTAPYTIVLKDVLVTSISQGDTAGHHPGIGVSESISLMAGQFIFTYLVTRPDGSVGTETYGWDCRTNSRIQ